MQWKVSNRSVSGASDAQARTDRRWSCRGTWSLVKSNPTKYLPSRPDLNCRKRFEMSLVKGSARAVPDFAKLHALEEQRVVRWKRQHKKDLTGCRVFCVCVLCVWFGICRLHQKKEERGIDESDMKTTGTGRSV